MTHPRKRLPNLLLALLLALMPLQSLLAGMLVPPASAGSHHDMGHVPAMSLHADSAGAMNPDCRHCQSPGGCIDQGCSLNHCFSCVSVLPSPQSLGMTPLRSTVETAAEADIDSHFASHPFRPPIA